MSWRTGGYDHGRIIPSKRAGIRRYITNVLASQYVPLHKCGSLGLLVVRFTYSGQYQVCATTRKPKPGAT